MEYILITGGSDGVGKAAATALAKRGYKIIIASRNVSKSQKAKFEIRKSSGNSEVHSLTCDLASFESVRNFAHLYRSKFKKLDVIINNAGVVTNKLQYTKEGFELQFGTNHLGHFLLTSELLNLLMVSTKPRIINVSSNAHFRGKIRFDSFRGELESKSFKGMAAYSQSKLCNVLFTKELARRYPKIISHSMSPGVVRTNIANKNDNSRLWKVVWSTFKPFMLTPEQGAKTLVFLAQESKMLKSNGRYFYKQKEIEPSKLSKDEILAKRLWEISNTLVNE